jgi:hypothetical protein
MAQLPVDIEQVAPPGVAVTKKEAGSVYKPMSLRAVEIVAVVPDKLTVGVVGVPGTTRTSNRNIPPQPPVLSHRDKLNDPPRSAVTVYVPVGQAA